MKLLLACNSGGHITEMLFLKEAFEGHDPVFLTYENPTTETLPYKTYTIKHIYINFLDMLKSFIKIYIIIKKEKPKIIISTGGEIAIPVFIIGKLMRIKQVYIESWCRVKTKSGAGRLVYYLADVFLVQWPDLAKIYGKKARYKGAVI
jgi:UDP-N-acetylglucosamine:LPS N-acetylglucosamine transferase